MLIGIRELLLSDMVIVLVDFSSIERKYSLTFVRLLCDRKENGVSSGD